MLQNGQMADFCENLDQNVKNGGFNRVEVPHHVQVWECPPTRICTDGLVGFILHGWIKFAG